MAKTIEFKGSSNVRSATMRDDGMLEVVFSNNARHAYANVSTEMFEQFRVADSAGRWFNANIKSKPKDHPGVQLASVEPVASTPAAATPPSAPAELVQPGDVTAPSVRAASPAVDVEQAPIVTLVQSGPRIDLDARVRTLASEAKVDENDCNPLVLSTAEALYAAYVHNSDNKNYRGEECPTWKALTPAVRSHWCAAAIQSQLELQSHVVGTVEDARTTQIEHLQRHIAHVESELDNMIATSKRLGEAASTPPGNKRIVHRPWIGRKTT